MARLNKLLPFAEISTARHIATIISPVLLILGMFVVFETFVVPMFTAKLTQNQNLESPLPKNSVQIQCIDRVLATINVPQPDIDRYQQVWRMCGTEQFNGLDLEDFRVRREKFTRQELDERVTLALVVGITISGVAMAALQLFMSYKLAQSGHADLAKDIELSIQKDRIAFKSSVIGLAILVISLAFFVVYVKWIYSIQEVPVASPIGRELSVSGTLVPVQGKGEQRSPALPPPTASNMP